jgi:hypothetical protein
LFTKRLLKRFHKTQKFCSSADTLSSPGKQIFSNEYLLLSSDSKSMGIAGFFEQHRKTRRSEQAGALVQLSRNNPGGLQPGLPILASRENYRPIV